jgi:hypothetical protein
MTMGILFNPSEKIVGAIPDGSPYFYIAGAASVPTSAFAPCDGFV